MDPAHDPSSHPQVTVTLVDAELPHDEWAIIRGRITNTGTVGVSALTVTLSGQVTTDNRTAQGTLEQLPPGRSADVPFHVRARQAGTHVPFTWTSHMNTDHAGTRSPRLRASGWPLIT